VHAEHREIFELAMAGMEARAALALEAHIRATPDLLVRALRDGRKVLPA
jgi:DNA-binding GntR family transcriptional regulator